VPDGKPALDIHLGEMIQRLRPLGLTIAVIPNASRLGERRCVRNWRRLMGHR
jgi:wyosine [tRNA(Phe)-imidazoG37] synthetase (radical SAM superfamily)